MKLNDPRDLRSLFFLILHLLVLALGLLTPPGLLSLLIVPTLVFTSYICLNINHNQMHVQLFKGQAANTILNVVLSIATGVPVTTIYVPHLFNHHPNPNTSKDWMGGHVVGNRRGLWRIVFYTIRAQIEQMKQRPRSLFEGLPFERKISLVCEALCLALFSVLNLALNPLAFLVHSVVPWVLSSNLLVFINFFLHDGCDANTDYLHSKTFTSRVLNFFLLNGGFHLAHHERPRMHWADLPDYHSKFVRPHAGETHEHPSMIRHFIKFYF